jgi:hypothetical protein
MNFLYEKHYVQVSQCADGAKCSRYGSSEKVTIKIQADKIRQISECCWDWTIQDVVVQLTANIGKLNFRKKKKSEFWSVIPVSCSGCHKLCNSYRYWRFFSPPRSGIRWPEMPALPKSLQKSNKQVLALQSWHGLQITLHDPTHCWWIISSDLLNGMNGNCLFCWNLAYADAYVDFLWEENTVRSLKNTAENLVYANVYT